jgi:Mg/Co/Ni transporter MgtE
MHALDKLKREILDFCQAENWRAVQQRLKGQYAGDLADVIEFLPPDYHQRAFSLIEEDTQPDVLAELE